MTAPPFKTDSGQEELRKRTRKLSQRHRTVLLLVDGKRSRAEVLGLAQKAGVAASFFEELVAMGLVDDGRKPEPAAKAEEESAERVEAPMPEPQPQPQYEAEPEPEHQPEREPEPVDEPEILPAPLAEPMVVDIDIAAPLTDEPAPAQARNDTLVEAGGLLPPLSLTLPPDLPANHRPARARVKFPAPAEQPPPFARSSGSGPLLDLPVLHAPVPEASPPTPPGAVSSDAAFEAEIDAEQRLLAEVRNLLIGTLLVDGPVSGSLIALRVGRARRREELVALVWEVERSMVRSRRPREAQARLIRARDLLGLGNTLVDDDSRIDGDSAW